MTVHIIQQDTYTPGDTPLRCARRGELALMAFASQEGSAAITDETCVDMLADVFHAIGRLELDLDDIIDTAWNHYRYEIEHPDE